MESIGDVLEAQNLFKNRKSLSSVSSGAVATVLINWSTHIYDMNKFLFFFLKVSPSNKICFLKQHGSC